MKKSKVTRKVQAPAYDIKEEIVTCDFGTTIDLLWMGKKMQRTGWNGKGMFIQLQEPDEFSKMQRPYIYMCCADQTLVPWVASQTDILSEDWQEYLLSAHPVAAGMNMPNGNA